MISFFNNLKKGSSGNSSFSKIAALLIHAAKIDQNFTKEENEIIKETLIELGANRSNIDSLINDAVIIEENSNQILDFTKEVKELPAQDKNRIVECLWKVIYSNKDVDMFEANLMRRLAGLLYIDSKTMGNIKEKVKREI
ncbi:TerB family tellurite resistance protein [Candidatus Pelagibacter sp.]|jgi:uncharacterized tellurite resistance protein B-like protein|nr:TerB family tellurite resistance protein [Candidatus Pelagibacter sp.]|tara:strand:+ start:264 stop:683 length:420 start_codon:yes stop_codon:yes gene_type:complete